MENWDYAKVFVRKKIIVVKKTKEYFWKNAPCKLM